MSNLFLVRYPEKPVQVPTRKRMTFGRTDDNDIVLHEARVSRKHAAIEYKKPYFVLIDLGSSNGTFLNNVKLSAPQSAALQNWDKIRIASAVFTARIVEKQSEIMDEFKELRSRAQREVTEIINLKELWNQENAPGFAGDLAHLCPVELFQMIESGGKSGIISMQTPSGEGTFTLSNGHLAEASFNNKDGEEAVYDVLNQNQGSFTFSPQTITIDNPQITMSITFLLIEGCRRLDEAAMDTSA
ncbi:MAG: FHA domain-containing protein [Chitinispirillaceae bacterium]|nr:FHA domain-containing protein [Chitinispirillaceae bacterium]